MNIKPFERRLYELALKHWGKDAQLYMVVEEAAELIKAVAKSNRRGLPAMKDSIMEEMADVEIMLGQLTVLMENMDPEFRNDYALYMSMKLNRLRGMVDEAIKLEEWSNDTGKNPSKEMPEV